MKNDSYFQGNLNAIYYFIQAGGFTLQDPSLKWGKIGLAVFLNQLTFNSSDSAAQAITLRLFEAGVAGVEDLAEESGLGEILSDLAGIIHFLRQNSRLAFDAEDLLAELDPFLLTYLTTCATLGNLDLVAGALAPAHYLLARATECPSLTKPLDDFILQLDTLATRAITGQACWYSTIFPEPRIYLGLSHGSASILVFLAKALEAGRQPAVCRRLLAEGVAYVLAQYRPDSSIAFPVIVGHEPQFATLGWAYGDLGVCYGLLVASQALGHVPGCQLAVSRALSLGNRIGEPGAWPDAGLAYGCTGSAVLFHALAQLSGTPAFLSFAEQCLARSSDFISAHNPACGFRAAYPTRGNGADWGIISGIAGIGVAFHAYLSQDYSLAQRLLYL
ncbi:hypothetical protein E5K00_14320 [Hymenobacter aquaticus]|uniref:Lanthionine synthetase n=1 Tax=Hymenobacter aquaticus TaxID=1867101 RepID=A0A4Z0PUP6_9BACT|nr:lanthionine synthetase LanC family protein [Hymenobacter aquaticus]TGE21458.1 hypothetical protein E5K00_14320 [Hymenobacter aquaticus]